MNNDLTLVIMAAGMGSRFGSLKQIEPFGPNGEFIIDYSIYDAIRSGFKKVIFIIKKENYEIFHETVGKRVEEKINVEYAFQEPFISYKGETFKREKPYGTAHAIYSVRNMIDGNFLVINSDDFYGLDAFKKASEYLKNNNIINNFGIVSYIVSNTLTENGSVKRGICETVDNKLKNIIESKIERVEEKLIASPLDGSESFEVDTSCEVSMNVLLFTPYVFNLIDEYFDDFINNLKQDETFEYLIPDVIKRAIEDEKIEVEVIKTSAVWKGVTYKEDKDEVVKSIRRMIDNGEYKENLWQD